jgi:hypothetical protein
MLWTGPRRDNWFLCYNVPGASRDPPEIVIRYPALRMSDETVTIRVVGNSLHHGEYKFAPGVTIGQVFDHVGAAPRPPFTPSHTIVVRRWYQMKPHSIVLDMAAESWREFALRNMDHVIYQYDVAALGGAG